MKSPRRTNSSEEVRSGGSRILRLSNIAINVNAGLVKPSKCLILDLWADDSHEDNSDNTRLSLLSFPGELRNRIYFYLFGGDILKLDYKPLERYLPRPRMLRFGLNLLLTCHTLERELCDYVFDVCTFSFYSDQAVWKFAGMVQETNVSRIQKLHLDVPLFYNTDIRRWSELFEKVVVKKFVELKYVEVDLQPRREVWVGRQPAALQEWISALKPLAAIKGGGTLHSMSELDFFSNLTRCGVG